MPTIKFLFLLFSATAIFLLCFDKCSVTEIKAAVSKRKRDKEKIQNRSLKEIVAELNGKVKKENYIRKSRSEAFSVFEKTGQTDEYSRTLKLSGVLAVCGCIAGVLMRNIPLTVVLGFGGYFLPLWFSRFFLFRYNNFMADELEVALSMITTSYLRNNDIVGSVAENIPHINPPVRDLLGEFVNNVRYVSSDILSEIETLKVKIDNKLFHQWCDSLILCQSDYTLKASLLPILEKFSKLKEQRLENETNMLLPMKEAIVMILITVSSIPLLYFINTEWFAYLQNTFLGQIAIAITAAIIFLTVNKAVKLSEPVNYDV